VAPVGQGWTVGLFGVSAFLSYLRIVPKNILSSSLRFSILYSTSYAECCYSKCRYAECCYSEHCYAECCYAECCGPKFELVSA
jgi:hypothetical protein